MGERWGGWQSAINAGVVFMLAFIIAQWPFADFLMRRRREIDFSARSFFGYSDPANLPLRVRTVYASAARRADRGALNGGIRLDNFLFDRDGARQLDAQGRALTNRYRRDRCRSNNTMMRGKRYSSITRLVLAAVILFATARPVLAHVGSADVFYEGNAGPYHLIVTVVVPQGDSGRRGSASTFNRR